MNLKLHDVVTIDSISDLRYNAETEDNKIIDKVLQCHSEDLECSDEDDRMDLTDFLYWFLTYKYPNKMIYTKYDEDLFRAQGYVYDIPDDIINCVRYTLEKKLENLPTEINTDDPIKKIIIEWRLKHG